MSATQPAASRAYQDALNLTRAGDLGRAESICRDILLGHSRHSDALLLLGVIELRTARTAGSIESFRRSLEVNPSQPIAHALLGDALLDLSRPHEALASYDRALQLDASLAPANFGRANALLDLRRPLEAIDSYDHVLRLQPEHPEALFNRGNALLGLARYAAAIESYDRALRLDPGYAAAQNNRGSALLSLDRTEEALSGFDAALALKPAFAEALNNRGCALLQLQRPQEALASHDGALRLSPGYVDAHIGRGNALSALRRFPEAMESYDAALLADPASAAAYYHRGRTLLDAGRGPDALESLDRAVEIKPRYLQALRMRGDVLLALQQPQAAAACFEELLSTDPAFEYTPGALLHARRCCADWSVRAEGTSGESVTQAVLAGERADSPFSFLAVADSTAAQQRCAQTFAAHHYPSAIPYASELRSTHDRIRVAYVSADFRVHAVSHLLVGVLERHDRQRFEPIGISLRAEEHTGLGQRIKDAFERFIDVSDSSDQAVAELLRTLEIDILVDLVGYTDGLRPAIFARRPAPIQVNYLGFPGTMGVDYMDYILADGFVIPAVQAQNYSEHVVYLPECFQANDDRRVISAHPITRAEAGLPEPGFVFCCFNNTYKLNPPMFDIWMRLLDRLPGSVLWLLGSGATLTGNLRREAASRGVDPQRLVFARREPYAEHLRRLQLADLFLDTLPFGAGATASDALWAGLPVLTCAGEAFAARMAGSLLQALGLPELITHNLADYEARALQLALQPDAVAALRRTLHDHRMGSPPFDTDRFRRHLEAAYERMWQRHERGEAPASFVVPAIP